MLKADPKGTPAQQWLAKIEYQSPRRAFRLQVDEAKRCATCKNSDWYQYAKRDGGRGASLLCFEISSPGKKGLTVQMRGVCIKWGPKP